MGVTDWFALATEICRPAGSRFMAGDLNKEQEQSLAEAPSEAQRLRSALIEVAAACHRAKWQFDDDKDPTGIVAFRVLHSIGDKARRAALDHAPSSQGEADNG